MSVAIRDLAVTIGGRPIVRGVDMDIADGERVGLVGSSGSGKSMISKAVMGLLPAGAHVSGSIEVGGHEIVGAGDLDLADLRGRSMGMVFQNPSASLNPVATVGRQIELPLRLHYDLTRDERDERVRAMIAKVGLPDDVIGKYPHQLSGGQRQRVGIATALVTSPRLIIADEPTTALDSITQRQIVDLLVSLVDDSGASMLFITHDFAVLAHATTRSYVLDAGMIAESGTTAGLLADPRTPQARALVDAARTLSLGGLPADGDVSGAAASSTVAAWTNPRPTASIAASSVASASATPVAAGGSDAAAGPVEETELVTPTESVEYAESVDSVESRGGAVMMDAATNAAEDSATNAATGSAMDAPMRGGRS